MYQKENLIIVYVYCDGKMIKDEKFISLNSARIFVENQLAIGNSCIVEQLENGRVWSKLKFEHKESFFKE